MEAEDQQRTRQLLQLFDDVLVAFAGREDLVFPARKRVGAGGRDAEADALGVLRELPADVADLALELRDATANEVDVTPESLRSWYADADTERVA